MSRHLDHAAGSIPDDPDRLLDLADVLDVLPDPRRRQGRRYRLGPILALWRDSPAGPTPPTPPTKRPLSVLLDE
ncbi:hypothetical protein [Streptomyces europaeiscabiei]|uniref:hypothetical protein n=1 Tax=Streptomyces europaeiscabiei TaxID=146819 RepID=UPI0029ACBA5E|nr:hypothetical protein [Streptomyces europaeiscabiei]MDX2772301.1 hypothetical protein [Streptomyces europaeiscabiei]MDX3833513.1 hypothetical protein [Streptomyces europaeiscabiei]